jgi:hypothetical protein
MRRSAIAAALVLVAAALTLGAGRTQAGVQPHRHWQGFDASSVTGVVETFTLDVGTFSDDGVAGGTLYASAGAIPFQVAISSDGRRFAATSVESTAPRRRDQDEPPRDRVQRERQAQRPGRRDDAGRGNYRFKTGAGVHGAG